MKLILKDADPELDGTSYALIEYARENDTPSDLELTETAQHTGYLRISSLENTPGQIEVGARIKYIAPGRGILTIDRYLRRDLNLPEGAEVEVGFVSPQPAIEIQIGIPVEDFDIENYKKICQIYLLNQPLSKGQKKPVYLYSGQEIKINIEMTTPGGITILTSDTQIKPVEHSMDNTNISYHDIGGLDNELRIIRERIEIPLKYFDHLKQFGIYPPRGILLYGPPGCGKTMIGRSLCNEIGATLFEIRGPEIIDSYYGKSEKNIREIFAKAKEQAPSVILIDEIESIASVSGSSKGDLEKRIATTILTEMERLGNKKSVIVIATTSNPTLLDPGLRRPGRFDYEIRIGIPDEHGRKAILQIHSRRMKFENKEETLSKIAGRTHGYTGADLMLLCREAAFSALQRTYPTGIPELPFRNNSGPTVQIGDFDSAMKHVKPTGMREFMVEVPSHLTWKNLGGLSSVKTIITEEVIESIRNPDIFRSIGIRPVKGILLYGPPGTGKTLLAKIIANEAGTNFIPIKGPEILSKWFGESEQRIRQIFSKAREVSPCVIFFDEIDAIFSSRGNFTTDAADRVVNQLLTEMDGFESSEGVYVIAATNRFELLDPAFLRPGRFDYQIFLPLPDADMRKEIFRIHLSDKPVTGPIDLDELAEKSNGFSGAHIAEVCRRSGITALKNSGFGKSEIHITMQYLLEAIGTIRFSMEKLERSHTGVEFA